MVALRKFVLGLCVGFLLMGCAGFSYKYYGLNATSYEGMLLGPEAKDDISFTLCQPTQQSKSPCVVMLNPEFFKMKKDLEETKMRLKACEKGY